MAGRLAADEHKTGAHQAPGISGRVLSVNTGVITDQPIGGRMGRSAIDKRSAAGQVRLGWLGLAGDECADTDNHGGREQAVYVYAREDLDWWAGQLGRELRDGLFGENVTTSGIDVSNAMIGDVWQLGTAVVQVTAARIPCVTFAKLLAVDGCGAGWDAIGARVLRQASA